MGVSEVGLAIQFPDALGETIPFVALSIGTGGFDHDQLIVKWTDNGADRTVYVKDPALIRSLRDTVPPDLIPVFERTAQQVQHARITRHTLLWLTAASALALPLLLWFGLDSVVRMAVDHIPVPWEARIGEAARHNVLSGQTVVKDGEAVAAIHVIAKRLIDQAPSTPYRFDITVVKSDLVNAVALPGGAIIVFTGLLKEAEGPDEVAGVLAHEMNHVLLRHGLQGTVKSAGLLMAVKILFGDQEGMVGLAEQLGIQLTTVTFSRQMETEADLAGLELLQRARISPSGLIRFFERLSKTDTRRIDLLSTHPMSATRAERVRTHPATMSSQPTVPIDLDWRAVKASL
ncbi:MAG: M48 family metallopeptidase [Nitrospiraceae bacterium]